MYTLYRALCSIFTHAVVYVYHSEYGRIACGCVLCHPLPFLLTTGTLLGLCRIYPFPLYVYNLLFIDVLPYRYIALLLLHLCSKALLLPADTRQHSSRIYDSS